MSRRAARATTRRRPAGPPSALRPSGRWRDDQPALRPLGRLGLLGVQGRAAPASAGPPRLPRRGRHRPRVHARQGLPGMDDRPMAAPPQRPDMASGGRVMDGQTFLILILSSPFWLILLTRMSILLGAITGLVLCMLAAVSMPVGIFFILAGFGIGAVWKSAT